MKRLLILIALLPLAVFADESLIQGVDSNNTVRHVLVDSSGRIVTVTSGGYSGGGSSSSSGASTYAPASTTTTLAATGGGCTTVGGAGCTVIYGSTDWQAWPRITMTITNSGANVITDCLVEWSADGTNWEIWDSVTFDALAASATKSIAIDGNSRRYLRIEANSVAGTTTIVTITAAQG